MSPARDARTAAESVALVRAAHLLAQRPGSRMHVAPEILELGRPWLGLLLGGAERRVGCGLNPRRDGLRSSLA